ncbi:MAG: complex I NDUFA9 subunit family protein [Rhodospirillales bacterium]|nr:complex I NDUFA9 subunit family protein [Rhodospirillales bacterium]
MERRVVTIFGGSGFVGRTLVQRLAAAGWIIRVVVRDTETAQALKTAGDVGQIVPMRGDITMPPTVAAAVVGADAVVNLVGILYEKGRRTFQRLHVDGAANVARAAREAGAQRLVQMSALGADAASPARYARTKAAGEDAAKAEFPGQFAALSRVLPALPVFPTRFQPVYVGDVADAIMRILDHRDTAGRVYELGGPRVYSFRQLMEIVLKETKRSRMLLPVPLAVAQVQAFFLQWLPVPPLTPDQVRLLRTDNVVSAGALGLQDLGVAPTAVEAIVPTYLARFRPVARQRQRSL